MECHRDVPIDSEKYWTRFSQKIEAQRIPFSGSIDLTQRCNLRCIHCYARPETITESLTELTSEQWKAILDEISDAGCLFLLITGGEPLIREDFPEIFTHAKKRGMLVTLFTNGTLVSQTMLDLFLRFPPKLVEISLYGATATTHDRITGISGSFDRSMQNTEMLIRNGINVSLKSVLLSANQHEFSKIEEIANQWNVNFRFDAAIFPTTSGDLSPIAWRVSPQQAIHHELADKKLVGAWQDFFTRFANTPPSNDLYKCGAGQSTFHIDAFGRLQPCLMVTHFRSALTPGSFRKIWMEEMSRLQEKKIPMHHPCNHCQQRLFCGYCPGFFMLENGSEEIPSDYLCTMGKLRYEKMHSLFQGGRRESKKRNDKKEIAL